MDRDSLLRVAGCALLGLWVGALIAVIARNNDQKRIVGFDPGASLTAACAPGQAALFTNRERLAVYLEKADGRVFAEPVYRGGEVKALACDSRTGEAVVVTDRGTRRVQLTAARNDPRVLARLP